MVSPGNTGLNAVHALSYGTPVGTHNYFNNQIEAAIIEDQQTGFFFNENDIDDLSLNIDLWFSKFDFNLTRAERRRIIDEKYNPEYQIKVIQKQLMKNNDTKRIYINLSNISTGGSIQVAMSFIEHFVKSEINLKFTFYFHETICGNK